MEEDSVVALPGPGAGVTADPLLAVLGEGARRMLTQAIEAEVATCLAASMPGSPTSRVVGAWCAMAMRRSGRFRPASARSRSRRPKVRDRAAEGSQPIRFTSAVLPG